MGKSGFADSLFCESVLLQSSGEGIFSCIRVGLGDELGAGKGGASDGMVEGLGLGFCGGGSREGGLGFGGGGGVREEVDFVANGAAEVVEGFADVWGIVVGFV